MRNIVIYSIVAELTLNVLVRSACSISIRIAALDHKSIHDAVECQSVIETFLCKLHKICYSNRRCICIQFHINRAIIFYFDFCMMSSCKFFGSIQKYTCVAVFPIFCITISVIYIRRFAVFFIRSVSKSCLLCLFFTYCIFTVRRSGICLGFCLIGSFFLCCFFCLCWFLCFIAAATSCQ